MSEEQEHKEDVKPKLTVQVQFQSQVCTVKVKSTTQFKKIFEAAETKFGRSSGSFKYTFEGERIRPEQTPGEFNMEDGDTIDAHLEQVRSRYLYASILLLNYVAATARRLLLPIVLLRVLDSSVLRYLGPALSLFGLCYLYIYLSYSYNISLLWLTRSF
ncbi:uncharacterized protein PHACADRAFT_151586 [Phanerochaete carnosa HHB-10118-sp]|uniref:Ubiquitin-like domain-containing protein n=1 Tax=Phanerochaete carnosa (strain HHB-10118-sp) TaxID=650164 RepID=K5WLA1_PHACS|nr:uncharacterized protein PHACADRAFT_151586 [Phanerochaete carnosa HHB-10118-sp]EKM51067.1 hypothetical protein PHACADRAFT_151586 [Phanerochaete carnosa HHB-10118-sp]